jgi:hypothetical protein
MRLEKLEQASPIEVRGTRPWREKLGPKRSRRGRQRSRRGRPGSGYVLTARTLRHCPRVSHGGQQVGKGSRKAT